MVSVRRKAIPAVRTGAITVLMALAGATGMAQDQGPGAGEEVIKGLTIVPVGFPELQPGRR